MRFPLSLTRSLTGYLLKQKLLGCRRFPLVLMLEPLHACNLSCAGCGRIREYASTVSQRMSLAECLASAEECAAPVVSICGGEPLLLAEIGELVSQLIDRRRHVYLCTNGLLLEKRLADLPPSGRLFLNVHLDGMEATHDRLVEHAGAFAAAVAGIRAAVAAGLQVTANTTVYRQSEVHEIAVLWEYLAELGVGTFMVSPAYGYEAVRDCPDFRGHHPMVGENGTVPLGGVLGEADASGSQRIFMTRAEAHEKFRQLRPLARRFRLSASPLYLDFLCGRRELCCAAWASPTRNVRGWRGPCYLVGDAHYATYRELIAATDWRRLGPGNDPRCADCLMHCGFEPAAVLAANRRFRDMLRMAVWQVT
jgi:MoaA/NifB/PqqE/SkfB family radical SAM enzyme